MLPLLSSLSDLECKATKLFHPRRFGRSTNDNTCTGKSIHVVCRAVVSESEKRNIAGVLGEEIQTLHIQNRGLQDEIDM